MSNFGTRWILALILIWSGLLAFSQASYAGALVAACFFLSLFFASASHFALRLPNDTTFKVLIVSSVTIGSFGMLLATAVEKLTGDSLGLPEAGPLDSPVATIVAGALIGGFVGLCSSLAMLVLLEFEARLSRNE